MNIGSREVFNSEKLPYDAKIEWIGRKYGDFSYVSLPCSMNDQNLKFDIMFSLGQCSGSTGFFGSRYGGGVDTRLAIFSNNDPKLATNAFSGYDSGYVYSYQKNRFYRLTNPNGFLVVDDVVTPLKTSTGTATDENIKFIGIFNFVDSSSGKIYDQIASRHSDVKFKYVKLSDNSKTLYDLIPVRVGDTAYLYDKVSHQLFGNNGTGSFIIGPDKN